MTLAENVANSRTLAAILHCWRHLGARPAGRLGRWVVDRRSHVDR
jgi:hypothetical protein